MEINGAKWWDENKDRLALLPALIFWVVSMICFVFGLSFKNPLGTAVIGIDLSLIIAIALSLSNTFVQIVGNDQDPATMDTLFKLGWWGSYILGIGSNVNALFGIIGVSNPYVQFLICAGLGTMIEVLPEKLLVKFLRSIKIAQKPHQSRRNEVPTTATPTTQVPANHRLPRQSHSQQQVPNKPQQPIEEELPEFLKQRSNQNNQGSTR